MNIETNLSASAMNKIVSSDGSLGGSPAVGVVTYVTLSFVTAITSGECHVACAAGLAPGDWFTSDADGLAVKVTTGFALGRILSAPVDGLALAVIGAVNL